MYYILMKRGLRKDGKTIRRDGPIAAGKAGGIGEGGSPLRACSKSKGSSIFGIILASFRLKFQG